MAQRREPGVVRDAIIHAFRNARQRELTVAEVREAVERELGGDVPQSSIRSYLGIQAGTRFERTGRGRYRLLR